MDDLLDIDIFKEFLKNHKKYCNEKIFFNLNFYGNPNFINIVYFNNNVYNLTRKTIQQKSSYDPYIDKYSSINLQEMYKERIIKSIIQNISKVTNEIDIKIIYIFHVNFFKNMNDTNFYLEDICQLEYAEIIV